MKSRTLIVESLKPLDELYTLVTEDDRSECANFSTKRQRERLAWRALLRHALRDEEFAQLDIPEDFKIEYSPCGVPFIVGCSELYFSISHTSTNVALVLSTKRCGIDIEQLDRNFERVSSRYISDQEMKLCYDFDPHYFMAIIWSAKEAIYKYGGVTGVDFLSDINIIDIDFCNSQIITKLFNEEVKISYKINDNFVICYTI